MGNDYADNAKIETVDRGRSIGHCDGIEGDTAAESRENMKKFLTRFDSGDLAGISGDGGWDDEDGELARPEDTGDTQIGDNGDVTQLVDQSYEHLFWDGNDVWDNTDDQQYSIVCDRFVPCQPLVKYSTNSSTLLAFGILIIWALRRNRVSYLGIWLSPALHLVSRLRLAVGPGIWVASFTKLYRCYRGILRTLRRAQE